MHFTRELCPKNIARRQPLQREADVAARCARMPMLGAGSEFKC
jgi:hypothetical protein